LRQYVAYPACLRQPSANEPRRSISIAPPRKPRLRSMVMVAQWPQKQTFRAVCHTSVDPFRRYLIRHAKEGLFDPHGHSLHESPEMRCFCGIYATKTLRHLWRQFSLDYYGAYAIGEVWLWGNVIEGTDGFRAQYAYPKQLFISSRAKRSAKSLRKTYGVPVTVVEPFISSVEQALEEQNGGR